MVIRGSICKDYSKRRAGDDKSEANEREGMAQSMEKRILSYRKHIDELLLKENVNWKQVLEEHLIQISFFQHERLIHLIVTITFALLEMLSIFMTVVSFAMRESNPAMWCLVILLLILLIPYIRHYYILENEVQKMYAQYDKLLLKMSGHS